MANVGFGKVILFGEHFVVYGIPAIASALDLKIEGRIMPSKEKGIWAWNLLEGRKVLLGRDKAPITDILPIFLKEFNLFGDENFYLELASNVPRSGGLGSSAALVVAVARAFNDYLKLNLSDNEINDIAFKAEKYFHSNPSGVDNTVATYGGMLLYKRGLEGKPNYMEKLSLKKPVEVVLAESSIKLGTKDTGEILAGVRKRKDENPKFYHQIFSHAEELIAKAKSAILENNIERIGELMIENQSLLKQIGVSNSELDEMCQTAIDEGAIGAKLTGTGCGGNIIALAPGAKLQEKISDNFEKQGYKTIKTRIG